MSRETSRRQLISTGCAVAVGIGIAGCSGSSSDGTTEPPQDSAGDETTEPPQTTTTETTEPPQSTSTETTEPLQTTTTETPTRQLTPPEVSFRFTYIGDRNVESGGGPWTDSERDGALQIVHVGGDAIPADNLVVSGDGATIAGDGKWHQQAAARTDADDSVTSGYGILIEVDTDYDVTLSWSPADAEQSFTLGTSTGPDA